jgi:hypothetical protein
MCSKPRKFDAFFGQVEIHSAVIARLDRAIQ